MKKLNKKGFTLIELLAVIVILAILVAVAVPAVTKYLNQARRGTFSSDAATMIEVARNDYLVNHGGINGKEYEKATIDGFLDKKLNNSPYGVAYSDTSYVIINTNSDGQSSYYVCLSDASGNGIRAKEIGVNKDENVKTGITCNLATDKTKLSEAGYFAE